MTPQQSEVPDTATGDTEPLLPDVFDRYAARPCLFSEDAVVTYGEVRDSIFRYARALSELELGQGDQIAFLSTNCVESLYVTSAIQAIGARQIVLHPLGSLDDHRFILEDAKTTALIFSPGFAERAAALGEKVDGIRVTASLGPSGSTLDLVAAAGRQEPHPIEIVGPRQGRSLSDADGAAAIGYTGGTTGRPKGVMISADTLTFMQSAMMTHWQWPQDLRFLISTPLSHAASAILPPLLRRGGSAVIMSNFDAGSWLESIERNKITAALIVPTQLYRILDHPSLPDTDISSLETIFYGAAPCSPSRLAEAVNRFGPVFMQFYGQSEAPMTVCILRKEDHNLDRPERLASCGRPIPGIEVQLLDEDGHEVGVGEPGEMCVSGPIVMNGYRNRPQETAEALVDGWLHTGDVAKRDDDGFLYIVDRRKDLVVSGGFNVFPREVEESLISHPSVSQAAVIGVPDPDWGESVTAFVVLYPGMQIGADELIAFVRERKGPVYAPKAIKFVDELPVSALGKIDKTILRSTYWEASGRQVH